MKELATALRLLGDETRLRSLRLLRREELNAGELAKILGLGSSAVSRQLATLRDAGVVTERRAGRYAYFRSDPETDALGGLLALLGDRLDPTDDPHGDLARLDDVLRARREEQVDADGRRPYVPGRSWAAWARVVGLLVPSGLRVADLGCGDGALALEVARFADAVVGIDRREAFVTRARAAAEKAGVRHARFETGDIECVPLEDGSVDVALLSQSLHVTPDAAAAAREAVRILAPGGRLLVMDLLPHDEAWVRERLGHTRQGFSATELVNLLREAGLTDVWAGGMPARGDDPFRPLLATGRKPGGDTDG